MKTEMPKHITGVSEARKWVITEAITMKPCKCPTCGQTVKLYPRKLSSALALFLIDIYNLTIHREVENRWVCVSRDMIDKSSHHVSKDYSKLRFWGLLQSNLKDPKRWRITSAGIAFVEGKMVTPEKAFVYNNYCVRLSASTTDIKTALGSKFDIKELMSDRRIK